MNAQVQVEHFKLTVENYHRMIETGIFGPEDRLELIEGELIAMVLPKPEHSDLVSCLAQLIREQTKLSVREEKPVTLPEHSEPEPDVALVAAKSYRLSHPLPDDIKLLVEVSDTSLAKDKQIKLPLYARCNIPEVWILDITARTLECYWEPSGDVYTKSTFVTKGQLISATLPEITIDVSALW